MHLYFAYGSNLNHAGMARRCPDSAPVGPRRARGLAADLPGRRRHRAASGARTHGALWKISERDLEQLDRYEGYPSLYGREQSPVLGRRRAGRDHLRDARRGPLPRASLAAYLETIRQGYEQWGLPKIALEFAVARVRDRLFDLGIRRFEPDGPKRLRPASQ